MPGQGLHYLPISLPPPPTTTTTPEKEQQEQKPFLNQPSSPSTLLLLLTHRNYLSLPLPLLPHPLYSMLMFYITELVCIG